MPRFPYMMNMPFSYNKNSSKTFATYGFNSSTSPYNHMPHGIAFSSPYNNMSHNNSTSMSYNNMSHNNSSSMPNVNASHNIMSDVISNSSQNAQFSRIPQHSNTVSNNCSEFLPNFEKKQNKSNSNESDYLFDLFGLKLYFDDILILSLLYFLYSEGVKDEMLFICLLLLLIT